MCSEKGGDSVNLALDSLRQIAHALAVQFGSNCEVVIHDITAFVMTKEEKRLQFNI